MVQVKHRYVPVTPLPAAQMGAPQIMHLAPLLLAARASRSEAISSLRLVSLFVFYYAVRKFFNGNIGEHISLRFDRNIFLIAAVGLVGNGHAKLSAFQ